MTAGARATDTKDTTLWAVLAGIREGRWQSQIEAVRQATGEQREQLKKNLPAVMFSGRFSKRKAAALEAHSGLLCADLDNLGPRLPALRAAFARNPHVACVFVSPSGNGLKVGFRVPADGNLHAAAFEAVRRYCWERYRAEIDKACSDVSRLCFVSHDENAWVNPQVIELPIEAWLPAALPPPPSRAAAAEKNPTKAIQPGNQAYTLPPTAQQLFAAGPVVGQRNNATAYLAQQMRDAGWPEGVARERLMDFNARGRPPLPDHEIESCLRSAYSRPAREPARNPQEPVRTEGFDSIDGPRPADLQDYIPTSAQAFTVWPSPIDGDALHGLAGDVVYALDPFSEADRVAVLATFLSAFGNMIGPKSGAMVAGGLHPARIWPVLVGPTAGGRKGTAWTLVKYLLTKVDDQWAKQCVATGLASGEGLIAKVRDAVTEEREGRTVIVDAGASDKRLYCVEEEFSSVLQVSQREQNILSARLRSAWDGGNLEVMTKTSPLRASGAHITILGHTTKAELKKCMTEMAQQNGFANRLLFFMVKRSKRLPDGGDIHNANLTGLVTWIRRAIDHAREGVILTRTPAAADLWESVYDDLTGGALGLMQRVTERAVVQVLRLSVIYALLDCREQVDTPHLRAALAVEKYSRESAAFVFGATLENRHAEAILAALLKAGDRGLTQTEVHAVTGRNLSASQISESLELLAAHGLAAATIWNPRTGRGRPARIWTAKSGSERIETNPNEENELNPLCTLETLRINELSPHPPGDFIRKFVAVEKNKTPSDPPPAESELLL
ncbi:MAG TPA: BT4734/BF3469 family protein [Verrucomicrobiota bacterium]|nr:BT4734/BF3469 family protein [Verrucomicrobiota bacterium]